MSEKGGERWERDYGMAKQSMLWLYPHIRGSPDVTSTRKSNGCRRWVLWPYKPRHKHMLVTDVKSCCLATENTTAYNAEADPEQAKMKW